MVVVVSGGGRSRSSAPLCVARPCGWPRLTRPTIQTEPWLMMRMIARRIKSSTIQLEGIPTFGGHGGNYLVIDDGHCGQCSLRPWCSSGCWKHQYCTAGVSFRGGKEHYQLGLWAIGIQSLSRKLPCPVGYLEVNETVRPQIIKAFRSKADADVGGPSIRYSFLMGNSHFCLVPRGLVAAQK